MGAERLSEMALADELAKRLDECRIDLWDEWGEDGPRAYKRDVEAALAKHRAARTVTPVAPVPGQLPLEEVRGWSCP